MDFASIMRELEAAPPGSSVVVTYRIAPGSAQPEPVSRYRPIGVVSACTDQPTGRRPSTEQSRSLEEWAHDHHYDWRGI